MLLLFFKVLAEFNYQFAAVELEILMGKPLGPCCQVHIPFLDMGCGEPEFVLLLSILQRFSLTLLNGQVLPLLNTAIETGVIMVENWNCVWGLFSIFDFEAHQIGHFLTNGAVNGPMVHNSLPSLVVV